MKCIGKVQCLKLFPIFIRDVNSWSMNFNINTAAVPVEHQKQFFDLLVRYYETNKIEEIKKFLYETSVSGIQFDKIIEKNPVSKEEFYRKKGKPSGLRL